MRGSTRNTSVIFRLMAGEVSRSLKLKAVLGPMAELGSVTEAQHAAMGRLAASLDIDALIVVGDDLGYCIGAPDLVRNAMDLQEAADTLHAILEPGDVVLVKASRSAGLERLAIDLIEEATA